MEKRKNEKKKKQGERKYVEVREGCGQGAYI